MKTEETYIIKFFPVGKGEWAVKLQSVKGQESVRFSSFDELLAFLEGRYQKKIEPRRKKK